VTYPSLGIVVDVDRRLQYVGARPQFGYVRRRFGQIRVSVADHPLEAAEIRLPWELEDDKHLPDEETVSLALL